MPPNAGRAATSPEEPPEEGGRRHHLWRIIFLSDTTAGRVFDAVLLVLIAASVVVVALESVADLQARYGASMARAEWAFTIVFTLEYAARLAVVRRRWRYATSFFGLVDLVSILPSYLGLLFAETHYLLILRVFRLLRVFRVLKLAHYVSEGRVLLAALRASRRKITVFLMSVLAVVSVEGTIMYILENDVNPRFSNIPQSIYWGIVTLTTVGYGDITPVTVPGKMMAAVVMLTGFSIIAVPTGIVTAELGREMARTRRRETRCSACGWDDHDVRARFCQSCGAELPSAPDRSDRRPARPW